VARLLQLTVVWCYRQLGSTSSSCPKCCRASLLAFAGASISRQYWDNSTGCQCGSALNVRWSSWSTSRWTPCHRGTWWTTANSSQPLADDDFDRPMLLQCTCDVPRTHTSLGDFAFTVAGPCLWNNLPVHLRDFELTLLEFYQLLKTHLFSWIPRRHVTDFF